MEAMETGTGAKGLGETTPVTGGPTATSTIYDVAALAGVATSSVSRALSNPGVSFNTAEPEGRGADRLPIMHAWWRDCSRYDSLCRPALTRAAWTMKSAQVSRSMIPVFTTRWYRSTSRGSQP
jgi:hypothetical protein